MLKTVTLYFLYKFVFGVARKECRRWIVYIPAFYIDAEQSQLFFKIIYFVLITEKPAAEFVRHFSYRKFDLGSTISFIS